jgi:hypothetical protein
MKIEKTHIRALLDNSQTRMAIVERLDDAALISADIELCSHDVFAAIRDAALDTLGNSEAPVVKTYLVEGGYGDYPIEIIGVVNWVGEAREK